MSKEHSVHTVIQSVRAEQRKDPRHSVKFGVRVFWQGESTDLIQAPGLVRDISANGLRLELARSLPKGKLLSVETTAGALQGIVRHVHQQADRCVLGMEIFLASDGSNHRRSLRNLEAAIREAEESR